MTHFHHDLFLFFLFLTWALKLLVWMELGSVSTGESRGEKSRAPEIIVIIIIFLKYPWMFEWG